MLLNCGVGEDSWESFRLQGNPTSLKNDRMISVQFEGKPFNINVIQVYASTSNAEEAEIERFCEDLQDVLEGFS